MHKNRAGLIVVSIVPANHAYRMVMQVDTTYEMQYYK